MLAGSSEMVDRVPEHFPVPRDGGVDQQEAGRLRDQPDVVIRHASAAADKMPSTA